MYQWLYDLNPYVVLSMGFVVGIAIGAAGMYVWIGYHLVKIFKH